MSNVDFDFELTQVRNARIVLRSLVGNNFDLFLDSLIILQWMRVSQTLYESVIFKPKNDAHSLMCGDQYEFYQGHYSLKENFANSRQPWVGFQLWEQW